ncbi:MAG TPA: phage Gp37/Gp68 family protein [Pseudonocardiaceae bacterium]
MGDGSRIEWTDATWNPVLGCTKVSPGCDRCYAMRSVHRMEHNPNATVSAAAAGLAAYRPGVGPVWTNLVRTLPDRLDQPLRWRRPRRVFVNSLSDLFHDGVPDEFIARVFAVMRLAEQHTFQVLTKRPGRMRSLLGDPLFEGTVHAMCQALANGGHLRDFTPGWRWPIPNVWIGVSVESQRWADVRVPVLLDIPAAVRWISAEPLLGPVDLSPWLPRRFERDQGGYEVHGRDVFGADKRLMSGLPVGWVVVGGESGPGARPMHPDWARSLRDQCATAGVPFLFKQWGEHTAVLGGDAPPHVWVRHADGRTGTEGDALADGSDWVGVYRVGKKRAGRELDGRTHDDYPAVT